MDLECVYNPCQDIISKSRADNVFVFPVCNLFFSSPVDLLMYYLLPYGLCPEGLSEHSMRLLSDLFLLKNSERDYVIYNGDGKIKIEGKKYCRIL